MDNTNRLFEAIEHPENFSEDNLLSLLADPETREKYELMCEMRASLRQSPQADLDKEWEAFTVANKIHSLLSAPPSGQKKQLNSYTNRVTKQLLRNTAAVIALAIISLTAIATVIGVKLYEKEKEAVVSSESINSRPDNPLQSSTMLSQTQDQSTAAIMAPVLFENEPLEEIIEKIRQHYGLEVSFKAADAKKLRLYFRWNPNLPIEDVIDLLNNFRQFSIYLSDKTLIIE